MEGTTQSRQFYERVLPVRMSLEGRAQDTVDITIKVYLEEKVRNLSAFPFKLCNGSCL